MARITKTARLCWVYHLLTDFVRYAVSNSMCGHAEYLFPEAYVKHQYSSLQDVPGPQLHATLDPRCSSPPSRLAALRLLRELTLHSSINLQTALKLVKQLHLSEEESACLDDVPLHALRWGCC